MLTRAQRNRRSKIRRFAISGLALLVLAVVVWFGMRIYVKEENITIPYEKQEEFSHLWLQNRDEPQLTMNQRTTKLFGDNSRTTGVKASSQEATYANSRSKVMSFDAALLVLVNKENMIPLDYHVELIELNNKRSSVASVMYEALCEMLTDGTKEGLSFYIVSGYRSYEKQQQLIEEDVAVLMNQGMSYEEAYEETLRETMPAGYSEHQTGLAVDIASAKDAELSTRQIETEENKWLQENCYKYGFIVRYPEGKSDITHIDYEPWHFRYVGKAVARYMMEHNLTLEEFLEEIEE